MLGCKSSLEVFVFSLKAYTPTVFWGIKRLCLDVGPLEIRDFMLDLASLDFGLMFNSYKDIQLFLN